MTRNSPRSNCAIHNALCVLGDRWTLVVVRDLLFSERATFNELLESPEKIATNTLADRLTKLEIAGIVEQLPGDRRYWLTEKGLALAPVLLELAMWSTDHDDAVYTPPSVLKKYQKDAVGFIDDVKSAARERRTAVTGSATDG